MSPLNPITEPTPGEQVVAIVRPYWRWIVLSAIVTIALAIAAGADAAAGCVVGAAVGYLAAKAR
jgi:hypothetical protein